MVDNNMTNNIPFISIIIATYNAEKYLERCFKSILSQTYKKFEILIQDGGSTDNTQNIINSYQNNIAYFASSNDNGIYDAWNRALPHCRGEWLCFMGADDYFIVPNIMTKYAEFLKSIIGKHAVAYGINHIVNGEGEVLYTMGKPWSEIETLFKNVMCLPHPGLMHHRSLFEKIGLFDESFKIAGDYDLLLRAIKIQAPVFWPNVVCTTPIGGISTLPTNNIRCLIEIQKAKTKNGINQANLYTIKQWAGAIIRLILWHFIGEKRSRQFLDHVRKTRGLTPFWTRTV